MNFQGEPGVPFSLNQIIPFGIQRFSRWLYVLLAALLVLCPLFRDGKNFDDFSKVMTVLLIFHLMVYHYLLVKQV